MATAEQSGTPSQGKAAPSGAAWVRAPYDGRLNVYRTAPQPDNEIRFTRFPCLTTVIRNNTDTRGHLLLDASKLLQDVPPFILHALAPLELWQADAEPAPALFFLELLFGESDALRHLRTKGYCLARNRMARQWSDYEKWRMRGSP